MLDPTDVAVQYSSVAAGVVDLTAHMIDVTVRSSLAVDEFYTASDAFPTRYVTGMGWQVSTSRFLLDDVTKAISATETDGYLFVLFNDSSNRTGLMIPARLTMTAETGSSVTSGQIVATGATFEMPANRGGHHYVYDFAYFTDLTSVTTVGIDTKSGGFNWVARNDSGDVDDETWGKGVRKIEDSNGSRTGYRLTGTGILFSTYTAKANTA